MPEFEACKNCGGYCCYVPRDIEVTYSDRVRISKELGLSFKDFTRRFTRSDGKSRDKDDGRPRSWFRFSMPCLFWIAGKCGIYAVRPIACENCEPYGNHNDCSEIMLDAIKSEIAPCIRIPY